MDATTVPLPSTTASPTEAQDHPGRWLGGVVGALASLVVGAAGVAIIVATGSTDVEMVVLVALLGMPVGFVLGRAALPTTRSDGWGNAIGMGLLIGFVAPILGALEIVLGAGAMNDMTGWSCSMPALLGSLFLLMYAIPFSFLAAVLTVPAGILWAIAVRAMPEAWFVAARMPAPIAALGVRHLALVLLVVLVVVGAMQVATPATCS